MDSGRQILTPFGKDFMEKRTLIKQMKCKHGGMAKAFDYGNSQQYE